MRLEHITRAVYKFSELSDTAKEHAKEQQAIACGFDWGGEAMDSIRGLAAHFGGAVSDWSIDWFDCNRCSMSFNMPDDLSKEDIRGLLKQLGTYNRHTLKGHGECKLTGYCMDEAAIDGFRWAFYRDKITDLGELMDAAYTTWIKAACADCEDQYSDEQFSENCEANKYEFDESGELI